jgi:hypothetical protein
MKAPTIFIAAIGCVMLITTAAFAQEGAQLAVNPQVLDIGAFYNGTTITATGTTPADSHVILRFVGATCDLHMKERGKVFGIMWMNLDSLTFKGVPNVCLVSSALAFDNLAGNAEPKEGSAVKALRLLGIKDMASIETNGLDETVAFEEFLKLKQGEGLYREMVGNISYGPPSEGKKSFTAEIPIPSRLTPGKYLVELVAVRDGSIIAQAQQPVTANLVGFPAMLANLAFGHGALYGVLATLIALLAGLAIGLVFQSKGAH